MPKTGFSTTEFLPGVFNMQHKLHKKHEHFFELKVISQCIKQQFVGNKTEIVQHAFKNAVNILNA